MTKLEREALTRLPLTTEQVNRIYLFCTGDQKLDVPPQLRQAIVQLCESHERLRMELAGFIEMGPPA